MQTKSIYTNFAKKSLAQFAQHLYSEAEEPSQINASFKQACIKEFKRRKFDLQQLDLTRLFPGNKLQTAHHQCLTNGPSFTAIDLVSTLGLSLKTPYFVGTYSAIPFDNNARSGCFCFKDSALESIFNPQNVLFSKIKKSLDMSLLQGANEKRISLIKHELKNQLLFNQPITESMQAVFDALQDDLQKILKNPSQYSTYNDWALDFCAQIQRFVLDKPNIYYFDLNRLIQDAIRLDLENSDPKTSSALILIDAELKRKIQKEHPKINLFAYRDLETKKTKYIDCSNIPQSWINNPQQASKDIKEFDYCPTIFLVFLNLIIDNKIKCIGSMLQHQYLSNFLDVYSLIFETKFQFADKINQSKYNLFSAARFPASTTGHAFDFFLKRKKIDKNFYAKLSMEYFWQEIKHKF